MTGKFFEAEPATWQELEEMVHQAFTEMGYVSNRAHKLATVRGIVEIDVHAIKTSTPIPTIVLCECKYWDKAVPQNVVHSFRSVCSDAGAHFGLIISKKGFQSGAASSRVGTNIHLMDFTDFQATYFEEWRTGASMMLVRMRSQILPLFRAARGMHQYGLDTIDGSAFEGVDPNQKYAVLFGLDAPHTDFFIQRRPFPVTFNDPRGDPRKIYPVTACSHREYLEICRQAVLEFNDRFKLPSKYFPELRIDAEQQQ